MSTLPPSALSGACWTSGPTRWVMIPLTRAIDTLVISLGTAPSPLRSVLRRAADQHPDFVEWIELPHVGT